MVQQMEAVILITAILSSLGSEKFVSKGPINKLSLVEIMTGHHLQIGPVHSSTFIVSAIVRNVVFNNVLIDPRVQ